MHILSLFEFIFKHFHSDRLPESTSELTEVRTEIHTFQQTVQDHTPLHSTDSETETATPIGPIYRYTRDLQLNIKMDDKNKTTESKITAEKDGVATEEPTSSNKGSPSSSEGSHNGNEISGNNAGFMFAFDDQSPDDSPRDRTNGSRVPDSPQRNPNEAANQQSPSNSPRPKKVFRGSDFLTQSSPPRFVSLDEIMKAADGVTNMALAHEIAVDQDFRFKKQQPEPDSLEERVRDIMHRAFWDVLEEKLREDPPDYSQALVLLKEVKESVSELLMPHHRGVRAQIEEVLDLELIEQQAEHGALDIQYYADFIITMMSRLCAPIRDEQIAQLTTIMEIIPLFKAIMSTLDVMKLDMANFTIQQIRPLIQNQSVEYEQTKFKQLLQQQKENNLDGLEYTKSWLQRAGDIICQQVAAQSVKTQSPGGAIQSPGGATQSPEGGLIAPPGVSPVAILNEAYMELLQWRDDDVFPETLIMDGKRFLDLSEKVKWLALVASVVMVTYNTVGDPIAGVRSFKEKIKNDIAIIISDIPFHQVKTVMPNVGQHVVKEVQRCLGDHGYQPLTDDRVKLLQGLIESVSSQTQAVHKCLRERLLSHIQKLLATPSSPRIQIPPGFAAMAEEFSHVYGQFLRLVNHNRAVYGTHYADIISTLLRKKVEEDDSS